jgi:hypothetical protein
VFEPFFSTKERSKGTGLGLSTCEIIVNDHGGWIEMDSKPDLGTTMRIYLPRVQEVAPKVDLEHKGAGRGTETILLVDDDASVRRVVRRSLEQAGYVVLEGEDGPSALRVFEERLDAIQLLMTDVVLPGFSGRELADRVLAKRPEMPVLFVSGYADDTLLQHRVSRRDALFLQKPVAPATVTRKVREILDAAKRVGRGA